MISLQKVLLSDPEKLRSLASAQPLCLRREGQKHKDSSAILEMYGSKARRHEL